EGDEPLALTRSRRPQTTFGGPATHRLDGHAEQLGRLTNANRPRCRCCDTYILTAFPRWIRRLASTKPTRNGPLVTGAAAVVGMMGAGSGSRGSVGSGLSDRSHEVLVGGILRHASDPRPGATCE